MRDWPRRIELTSPGRLPLPGAGPSGPEFLIKPVCASVHAGLGVLRPEPRHLMAAAVAWSAPWICVVVISTLIAGAADLALNYALQAPNASIVLASPPANMTSAPTCEPTYRMIYVASLNECMPVEW